MRSNAWLSLVRVTDVWSNQTMQLTPSRRMSTFYYDSCIFHSSSASLSEGVADLVLVRPMKHIMAAAMALISIGFAHGETVHLTGREAEAIRLATSDFVAKHYSRSGDLRH